MGVRSGWIEAIRIFAGIEQSAHDPGVPELRGEGECEMTILRARSVEQAGKRWLVSQGGGNGKIDLGSEPDQLP